MNKPAKRPEAELHRITTPDGRELWVHDPDNPAHMLDPEPRVDAPAIQFEAVFQILAAFGIIFLLGWGLRAILKSLGLIGG